MSLITVNVHTPSGDIEIESESSALAEQLASSVSSMVRPSRRVASMSLCSKVLEPSRSLAEQGIVDGSALDAEFEPLSAATIVVNAPDSEALSMEVNLDETAWQIKSRVQDCKGIPVDMQRLVFAEEELDASKPLVDCGIGAGSVLELHHQPADHAAPTGEVAAAAAQQTPGDAASSAAAPTAAGIDARRGVSTQSRAAPRTHDAHDSAFAEGLTGGASAEVPDVDADAAAGGSEAAGGGAEAPGGLEAAVGGAEAVASHTEAAGAVAEAAAGGAEAAEVGRDATAGGTEAAGAGAEAAAGGIASLGERPRRRRTFLSVFVRNIHSCGGSAYVTVDIDATVASVKAQMRDRKFIAIENQRLVFRGQQLHDAARLTDYGIEHDSRIFLIPRYQATQRDD